MPHATSLVPIAEFDDDPRAIIEAPRRTPEDGPPFPKNCVLCFFDDVVQALVDVGRARPISPIAFGSRLVYEVDVGGKKLALFRLAMGAPKSVCFLEMLIGMGMENFIVCGAAGVLTGNIPVTEMIVTDSAVRDEGTSYHYLPPSREVEAAPEAVEALKRALARRGATFHVGKSWTTDALFRETRGRMERRRAEGCISVEMEASALFAVAKFRGVKMGCLFYGADDLSGADHQGRDWEAFFLARAFPFDIAAEACLEL